MIFVGATEHVPPQSYDRALVSIVIGDEYMRVWSAVCRASWEAYAAAHGYDLIVIDRPFDPPDAARRSPAWQKCLILDQPWSARYRRVVWLDADIIANPAAPDIADAAPEEMVGATLVQDQLSASQKHILMEKTFHLKCPPQHAEEVWGAVQNKVYRDNGIETDRVDMAATGVMVLTPRLHSEVLRDTYGETQRSRAYEQPYLSIRLLERRLFHKISPRWNWGVWDSLMLHHRDQANRPMSMDYFKGMVRSELDNAYFLHFYQTYFLLKELGLRGWAP